MGHLLGSAFLACSLLASGMAAAEEQTVTLAVSGMTCPSCAYIVGQTLGAVDGVTAVEIIPRQERAIVSFDDTKCAVADLIDATGAYGYSSKLVEDGGQS